MKASINDIKKAFDLLINEEKSREELASWALKFQLAEDNNDLEYDPPYLEDKIWDGIQYLTGVDLKDLDGSYLHSIDNFIEFRKKCNL